MINLSVFTGRIDNFAAMEKPACRLFGLIGYPLSHSFSKLYFTGKFAREGIEDARYELFPIPDIKELPALLSGHPELAGLNVTIPYKQAVIPYLSALDPGAEAVGAVNTIKIENGIMTGYNTDVAGFAISLRKLLRRAGRQPERALVLGTGGAARAVTYVLDQMEIPFVLVSRTPRNGQLSYDQLRQEQVQQHQLIINTTPLGMSPNVDTFPPIPYAGIGAEHILFDLVYNPETTTFLRKGAERGAVHQNGLEMLYGQAEKAWEIWQSAAP